jgi:hypothetical protein
MSKYVMAIWDQVFINSFWDVRRQKESRPVSNAGSPTRMRIAHA